MSLLLKRPSNACTGHGGQYDVRQCRPGDPEVVPGGSCCWAASVGYPQPWRINHMFRRRARWKPWGRTGRQRKVSLMLAILLVLLLAVALGGAGCHVPLVAVKRPRFDTDGLRYLDVTPVRVTDQHGNCPFIVIGRPLGDRPLCCEASQVSGPVCRPECRDAASGE